MHQHELEREEGEEDQAVPEKGGPRRVEQPEAGLDIAVHVVDREPEAGDVDEVEEELKGHCPESGESCNAAESLKSCIHNVGQLPLATLDLEPGPPPIFRRRPAPPDGG